ncbi:MAG TPA: nitronate monooxygenase [Acidimicrobiales bacterium]|jgi:nitronate monooxygenase|nr:nitronate monooxygenase [Acidimicrobiales bacterium]
MTVHAGVEGLERLRALARWPLAVSPMAGGPSTVDLVVAASRAGAFAFLAGGYKKADELRADMAAVAAAGVAACGVNLFVPGRPTEVPHRLEAYLSSLRSLAGSLGAELGPASWDDDDYPRKLELVLADPPPAVSFTFGVPEPEAVRALQRAGALVMVTVTTPEEAALALRVAPDALCLQGAEAGAHRGSFANDDRPDADRPLRALLAAVRRRTLVPLVAAGGVAGPGDVVDLLARGAALVQTGTAFLRCPESGAQPAAKDALADEAYGVTAVTRAFSGRRARALVNAMVREHPDAPPAYPEINNATRPLRAAAARAGDPAHMSLYAGTGFRAAGARPAAEVVEWLVSGWRR